MVKIMFWKICFRLLSTLYKQVPIYVCICFAYMYVCRGGGLGTTLREYRIVRCRTFVNIRLGKWNRCSLFIINFGTPPINIDTSINTAHARMKFL